MSAPDPLLLVPGLSCDARIFAPQLPALSRHGPVMIGHVAGAERIEEMASALLTTAPPRFALAGWGLGGLVALELLRRAPKRVSRAALLSTAPLPESPQMAALREPRVVAARAGRLEAAIREEFAEAGFATGAGRVEALGRLVEMGRDLGPEVFVRQIRALQKRRDMQGALAQVRQPVLVLCGAHDRIAPPKRQEVVAGMIPDAHLTVIEDAGHVPTLESPDAVTDALVDFLAAAR